MNRECGLVYCFIIPCEHACSALLSNTQHVLQDGLRSSVLPCGTQHLYGATTASRLLCIAQSTSVQTACCDQAHVRERPHCLTSKLVWRAVTALLRGRCALHTTRCGASVKKK